MIRDLRSISKGWVNSRPRNCNLGFISFIFAFLKEVIESNLYAWSGNKIEKETENESRNEFDVNRVGKKICQILELELAFVAS